MIEKINIKLIDLEYQKNYDVAYSFIEIYDNRLRLAVQFTADEPKDKDNLELGWEEKVPTAFDTSPCKEKISGFEKWYVKKTKVWGVCIIISGYSDDLKVYFKKESEATALYEKLLKWKFN